MVWNDAQFAGGMSVAEILGFKKAEPLVHRIVPDAISPQDMLDAAPAKSDGMAANHEQAASALKIRCDQQGGFVEIIDPRMFIPEKQAFCRALSDAAIGISGALKIDVDLSVHLCRFHFERNRYDESELARRVALAIKEATPAVQPKPSTIVNHGTEKSIPAPGAGWTGQEELPVMTDSERWLCMAMGGGSLVAALAGLIVPGIPSRLFSCFQPIISCLRRLRFNAGLKVCRNSGKSLRKLEASGQVVLDRSTLLKSLGMAILLGLMFLVIHPPLPLVVGIELGLTVFVGLREIGDLEFLSDGISKVLA